jgi:hypothetical protein
LFTARSTTFAPWWGSGYCTLLEEFTVLDFKAASLVNEWGCFDCLLVFFVFEPYGVVP